MKPNNPPEHHLSSLAGKLAGVFYSLCCYLFFLLITLYLIGFLSGIGVPKDINTGPSLNWPLAVIVDTLLITLFAVQHSGMARQRFKRWWTQCIPPPIERATYVLSTCIVLTLLFWLWQPITTPIWNVTSAWGHKLLMTLFWLGCGIAILATFLISHFELLGIQQTLNAWRPGRPDTPTFKTPLLYKLVRHPLYLGFVMLFWATPDMTAGHLLFALLNTVYILIGAHLEEKDLIDLFGERYQRYQRSVAMLIPLTKRKTGPEPNERK